MARYLMLLALIVLPALFVGCGGKPELAPDDSQVPKVDPVDIQKEIQKGMQQSGEVRQPEFESGK